MLLYDAVAAKASRKPAAMGTVQML